MSRGDESLDPTLRANLQAAIEEGQTVTTLSHGKSNEVVEITDEGVWIETERSRQAGGPRLVPAWMLNVGWRTLVERGEIRGPEFRKIAHRSSAVLAILAKLPGVEVVSSHPILLRRRRP